MQWKNKKATENSIGKFVSRFVKEKKTNFRYPEVKIINLDLPYDIVLTLNLLEETQITLQSVYITAAKVLLRLSAKKSEAIVSDQHEDDLFTRNSEKVSTLQDFKYLGYGINDSENNIKFRKKQAWLVCN